METDSSPQYEAQQALFEALCRPQMSNLTPGGSVSPTVPQQLFSSHLPQEEKEKKRKEKKKSQEKKKVSTNQSIVPLQISTNETALERSVSSEVPQLLPTTICVDLLNYGEDFFKFSFKNNSDFEKNLKFGKRKIRKFVQAAKNSGYKIIGFIDKAAVTNEALNKWYRRRIKELESGHRKVFAKLNVVVGTIFASYGVDVHYSTIDCDDTIAAFAHKV